MSYSLQLSNGETGKVNFLENDRIAVGSDSGAISLYRLEADGSITNQHTLSGHSARISNLQLHPHRPVLASTGADGSVRLWDSNTGASLAVWYTPGPFWGTNIHSVQGLTPAQKNNLLALGAVDVVD